MLGGRGRGGDPTSDCILSSAWRRSPEAGEREEVVTRSLLLPSDVQKLEAAPDLPIWKADYVSLTSTCPSRD